MSTADNQPRPSPVFLTFPPDGCLRPRLDTDEEVLRSCCGINHPENRPYLARNYPQTLAAQREWFQKPDTEQNIVLVVEAGGEAVGTMGAHRIDYVHGTATTGALFWEQRHWNLGIGHKAKMVFLDHLFNRLNLRIVYSHVIGFNGRSAKYSDKCGYKLEATLKDHLRFGDTFADKLILSVTRERFRPLWAKFQSDHGIETMAEMLERHRHINRSK